MEENSIVLINMTYVKKKKIQLLSVVTLHLLVGIIIMRTINHRRTI